ncbi:ATP-binding protein [Algoriphagus namhaensis]|uniref:histidine kinase n=1 Tax=Algoriphagus namhaensis TaxID=915353 RepID=A0ABV8AQB4_9BACT
MRSSKNIPDTELRKEHISIIQDNSSGISASIKEKIFQPFFTTKPTGSGTRLGLSLSYDIIKAHCGTTQFESTQEGTLFTIALPLS